jgi:hypothetical protein
MDFFFPIDITFYDTHLRKQMTGSYKIEGGTITVTSADGTKSTPIGPVDSREGLASLARILMRELARTATEDSEVGTRPRVTEP